MTQDIVSAQEGADESRPLLGPSTEAHHDASRNTSPSPPSHHASRCTWPWLHVVALVLGIAVISDIGESLYVTPRIRLLESVICTRYYLETDPSLVDGNGAVAERFCKADPVQDELAYILGWQSFFDSLPAIILPIPYGYLADRHGRKWIMVLAMVGFCLSYAWTLFAVATNLPLQFVWLSSLFHLIGGGPNTATTLLTTIVADVVPPGLRSTVFFYRFCTDLVTDLFVPPITSYLMSKNVWIPLIGAVIFLAISITLVLFTVPETLPIAIHNKISDIPDSPSSDPNISEDDKKPPWNKKLANLARQTKESYSFVTRSAAIGILVMSFFISKVGRQSTTILFQYASKKYGWTLSQAGLLLSLRAAVNIVLFLVILPAITNFVLSRLSAAPRDLFLAKGSIIFLAVGAFAIFISATSAGMIIGVVLFTLGTGFPPVARSLVTLLVESHDAKSPSDIGRLYALISAMEGIGSLVAAPGMAWAFRCGINLGQAWLGLPFLFASVMFTLVSILVFFIRV